MSFGNRKIEVSSNNKGLSKYITYGNQELRINALEIKVSQNNNKQIIAYVETPTVDDEKFVADESAKNNGRVGKVALSWWMKNSEEEGQFEELVHRIADAMGTRDQLKSVKVETLEDYVEAIKPIITGKFAWFTVSGKEYEKMNGTGKGITLSVGRWSVADSEDKLQAFDKSKKWMWNPLTETQTADAETANTTEESDTPW